MDTSALKAALLPERENLIETLIVEILEVAPFYREFPRSAQVAMSARLIDLYLDALDEVNPEALRTFGIEIFTRRQEQGASLLEVLHGISIGRRAMARGALRILSTAELAGQVIERAEQVADELVRTAVAVYEKRRDTERRAFEALEERYQRLYQRTPAIMHSIDREGRITAVSDHWLDVLGYTRDEVLGRHSIDFLTEASRKTAVEVNIPKLRAAGHVENVRYQFIRKNGDPLDVRLSSVALRDERGENLQFLAVAQDISAEMDATRALRESEERWRGLTELAPLPLAVHKGGVFLWVNEALSRLLGVPRDELVGMNVMRIVHPEDHELLRARLQQSREGRVSLPPIEERYLHADGTIIYTDVAARPVVFEGENATQIAVVDVTARRHADEVQRQNEAQARLIEAQEATLRALSTPLIPIGEGILVAPLIGRITGDRAAGIVETIAAGVVAQGARVAIVDVTGVPEADASVVEALVRVAQAIRLLGAEVVITGIQPSIARTLVDLGADLGSLTTRGTLRDGITHALRARPKRRA
ncbi:PAS domain S-box protein [Polyangium jinanense]|uniref:PAS domain S-box protein n=1 Tax=Polyangium jinanense TaxID=2829994 RepID=A0A9X3X8V8_9BACT|nr:PAS domain S-box protein [Polyangium jinanense]MDC3958165.1 PAS domain S-box protein [Polyangium jinanense]MDC3983636.1 PAS domain S-box protein [Polyangium jinanense]